MILRHASPEKSSPDGTDATRPLTPAGEEEAMMQGNFLKESGLIPDYIAASTAVRALRTAEVLALSIGHAPEIFAKQALYNAPGDALLAFVQALPESVSTPLVVAHMPGVAELLLLLTPEFAEMGMDVRPCTLASVTLEPSATWKAVTPGSGALEWLLPPLLGRE